MTHLLEKNTPFIFSDECIQAFQMLKKKLTEPPILIAPDWDLPFELMCDASDFAIGAVLGQRHEKHFRPIHYASKTMNEAESHYTTTKKEMLAVDVPDFEASRADGFVLHSQELHILSFIWESNILILSTNGCDEGLSALDTSIYSKAFKIFNTRTRKVEENLHITFLENKPNVTGSGPDWLFDIDLLTNSMNYEPVTARNFTPNDECRFKLSDAVADDAGKKTTKELANKGERNGQEKEGGASNKEEPKKVTQALIDPSWIEAMQDELLQFRLQKVWRLVDSPKGKHAIGTKWVYRTRKDRRGADSVRIGRLMDVKSAFLYGTIKEEVYVCQPPGFEDPQFPDKVYKVEKALYGLHQAPKAWYETLSTYLFENRFRRVNIDKTLFIKKDKGDILLVHVYVDDIIFGSTKKSLCVEFEQMMHKRFQMSFIRELTFFLGLQVKQKDDGIFISQDKYVADILKKFDFVICEDKKMIYAVISLDRKSTFGVVQFLGKRLISWQCKKQTIVANSTTEAEYVATANCCRQETDIREKEKKSSKNRQNQARSGKAWKSQNGISDKFGVKTGSCKVNAARQDLVLLGKTKTKIVNNETQIHAKVDGKTIVISESSARSNLYFNDEDGVTSLTISKILENLALMGYEITQTPRRAKRGRDTKIPQSGGPPKKVGNEAVYIIGDDRVVRATTTASRLEAEQESGNIHKTQSTLTFNESPPQGTGSGSGPRCQDTTLRDADAQTSGEDNMEHQDDLTNFVPPTPHDSPLSGGHTPGSDEGRLNIKELMAICTNLSNRVLALETLRTAQDLVIRKLKKKVKRLEKKLRIRTPGMQLFKIGDFDDDFDDIDDMVNEEMKNVEGDTVNTATTRVRAASASVTTVSVSISTAKPRTPPTTTKTAFKDEDLTIAQTLVKIRSQKDKEKGKGVAFRAVQEESARPTRILLTIDPKDKGKGIMQEPEKPPKNPIKAHIQRDAEIA
ncbi:putative ribonuclease H-like domain-containing protein [Tanacetum coccineum]